MGAARQRRLEARTKRQESLHNRGVTVGQDVPKVQAPEPKELGKIVKIVVGKRGRPSKLVTKKNHTGIKKTDGSKEKE